MKVHRLTTVIDGQTLTYLMVFDKNRDRIPIGICYVKDPGADHAGPVLMSLWVHAQYRRNGIGGAILMEAGKVCKEKGQAELWLLCFTDNPAFKWYESISFRATSNQDVTGATWMVSKL